MPQCQGTKDGHGVAAAAAALAASCAKGGGDVQTREADARAAGCCAGATRGPGHGALAQPMALQLPEARQHTPASSSPYASLLRSSNSSIASSFHTTVCSPGAGEGKGRGGGMSGEALHAARRAKQRAAGWHAPRASQRKSHDRPAHLPRPTAAPPCTSPGRPGRRCAPPAARPRL